MGSAVQGGRVPAGSSQKKGSRKELREEKGSSHSVPIWLRILLVASICLVALLLGSIIGYGVVGDGVPTDALKFDTWSHIIELVTSKE